MASVTYYNTKVTGNTSRVHGKWVGYNTGNRWDAIDARFANDGSSFGWSAGPMRFYAPQFANGVAVLEANNRYDIFSRSAITTPAMEFAITPENVSAVAGRIDENNPSQVWYDNAWGPGLSLRYTVWHGRAPRVTREAVIDPQLCPQGRDLQASWLVRSPRALTLIDGARPKNPDGSDWTGSPGDTAEIPTTGAAIHYFDGQADPVRGSGFKPPKIWYWDNIDPATGIGTLVSQPATVTATIVTADTIRLTKTIPAVLVLAARTAGSLLITDDVQTIYPDPNVEVTTWDGHVGAYSGDWATVISKSTVSAYCNDYQATAGVTWDPSGSATHYRFISLFDLAAVSGTVSAASWHAMRTGGYNRSCRLTAATTASNTGFTASDYQNTYLNNDTSLADAFLLDSTPVSLNATGVAAAQSAVGGILKLSCRAAEDYIGATVGPAGGDTTYLYTADSANDPYIEITTAAAALTCHSSACSFQFGICLR